MALWKAGESFPQWWGESWKLNYWEVASDIGWQPWDKGQGKEGLQMALKGNLRALVGCDKERGKEGMYRERDTVRGADKREKSFQRNGFKHECQVKRKGCCGDSVWISSWMLAARLFRDSCIFQRSQRHSRERIWAFKLSMTTRTKEKYEKNL